MWSLIAPNLHLSSFIWTTHRTINGSTSRFHLGVSTLSYPFQHALWQDIWNSLCPNFIMFWPRGECLVYNSTNLPRLSISFPSLSHNISYTTWIAPSLNCKHSLMRVHTSPWPYGYTPLTLFSWQWMHMNPWCTLRHLCYHCARCWLPHGATKTTCISFKHVQLLLSTNRCYVHQI